MRSRVIFLLLCAFSLHVVSALEVGVDTTLSNMNFHPDRNPTNLEFSPYYFPLGYSIYGHHAVDEYSSIDFGFRSDRVLRNYLYGSFSYSGTYYAVEVGPIFGTFNTSETYLKPGILASVKFQKPGTAFIKLRSSRSLNVLNIFTGQGISGSLSDVGDFSQEENEIAVGFYLRNTICSFLIKSKIFSRNDSTDGVVTDSMTDYSFVTDIFQKNAPFKIMISMTYRNYSRNFEQTSPTSEHTIGSLIMGTRLDYAFRGGYALYAELESSVYSFGMDDLFGEFGSSNYLFTLTLGFKINLDPYLKKADQGN